jgi:hypothetical protein
MYKFYNYTKNDSLSFSPFDIVISKYKNNLLVFLAYFFAVVSAFHPLLIN